VSRSLRPEALREVAVAAVQEDRDDDLALDPLRQLQRGPERRASSCFAYLNDWSEKSLDSPLSFSLRSKMTPSPSAVYQAA